MTDVTRLAATHAAAFAPARGWGPAEIAGLLDHPTTCLIGDDRAYIIARWAGDEAEILTLATHPDHRRKGLARTALTDLHRSLPDEIRTVFLEVASDNAAARSLYEAAGYLQAGQRHAYYPRENAQPADALILRKALQTA